METPNNEGSIPLLDMEMDFLHAVLFKTYYSGWMTKEIEKRPATPIINPDTCLEVKWNVSSLFLMFLVSVRHLEESFDILVAMWLHLMWQ